MARVRDILLRIRGDASDAQSELHDIARELKQFDQIEATATADVNTKPAQLAIDSAKNAVKEFGRLSEQAKVDLQTTAAETKLRQLRTNLDNLSRKETSPKVTLAIGRTVAQIERIEAQLDKLDRRRIDIDVDVDRHGRRGGIIGAATAGVSAGANTVSAGARGLSLFAAAATTAVEAFGSFVNVVSRGFGVLGSFVNLGVQAATTGLALGAAFAQVGVAALVLIPVLVVLVATVGTFLVNAMLAAVAAVAALGASLLAAAAGVGVLGVALAGAFGPVVLLAIAAMARFTKILAAVKEEEDRLALGAKGAAEALEKQRDAAEEVSDAVRGIAQAELSREQAALNVEQAEQALKDLRKESGLTSASFDDLFKKFTDVSFRPVNLIKAIQESGIGKQTGGATELDIAQGILNLRQARLNEKDAIDGVSDAHERLSDARQTEADAIGEQNEKLAELNDTERKLVDVIVKLKKALTDLFAPATRRIFDGLIDMLEDVGDFASDRRVIGGFEAIGQAIGDAFRTIGDELGRREVRNAFGRLADGAGKLIGILTTDVFRSVFRIIMRIAREALPWLIDVAEAIGGAFKDIEKDTRGSKVKKRIDDIKESFDAWWGVAKELWGIVKTLFGAGKKEGDKLAETIRTILRRWRNWLEANPKRIEDFFKSAEGVAPALESIATSLGKIVGWLERIRDLPQSVWDDLGDLIGLGVDVTLGNLGRGTAPIRHSGGPIGGVGDVPILAQSGEYMIRRSVAQAIGVPRLNLLNAGNLAALGGGGRGDVNIGAINLPPAPGHGQLGDPRHQAVQLARELRRRGGFGLSGGGTG